MTQTIALVDDDRNLLTGISIALEREGFKVQTYIDGETALNDLTRNPPDLAVIDIKMPRMDGEELLTRLRKKIFIPIIFLTSKSQTQDVVEGFHIGGNDYLKKPFSMEELIVRINNLLQNTVLQKPHNIIKLGDYTFNFTNSNSCYRSTNYPSLARRCSQSKRFYGRRKNNTLSYCQNRKRSGALLRSLSSIKSKS